MRSGLLLAVFLTVGASAQSFTNPLLDSGPDPWVVRDGSTYYYTNTLGDRLQIWKTENISKLRSAATKVVWRAPASGPNSASVWAPELHRIAGKWFLYYTAADKAFDDDAHRHIFVLENDAADPLTGTWIIDRGMLRTDYTGIDGTVFEDSGKLYFVYSAYVGPESHLVIAEMQTPWLLTDHQVDIARPTYDWEKQGGRQILEGPEFLPGKDGRRFLVYSASACWSDDYSLGMLSAEAGADLLDPAAWRKSPSPVFKKAIENGVFAPGHNGFFDSPDGKESWIVYHANSASGQGCGNGRSPRIQKFDWSANGTPQFGVPLPGGVPLAVPSGQ